MMIVPPLRHLPRTGQTTERRSGDDGTYQTGWPGSTRFKDLGTGIIHDRSTGLYWIKEPQLIIPGGPIGSVYQALVAAGNWAAGHGAYAVGDLVYNDDVNGIGTATASAHEADEAGKTTITANTGTFPTDVVGQYWIGAVVGAFRITHRIDATHIYVQGDASAHVGLAGWVIGSYYICIEAHASHATREPPNATYWIETHWTGSAANLTTPVEITWNNAIDDCLALDTCDFDDWRLPNINELLTLMKWEDAGGVGTLIDRTMFPNTQNAFYYSSTTRHAVPTYAIRNRFTHDPEMSDGIKVSSYFVRPVRGSFLNG